MGEGGVVCESVVGWVTEVWCVMGEGGGDYTSKSYDSQS